MWLLLRGLGSGMLLAALAAAGSAQATVLVEAFSVSQAQSGQQPVSSSAFVRDGALVSAGSNVAGPNGSSNAGPIGPGATSAFADTTQISGPILANSRATADLALGSLGNYAEAGAGTSTAIANSRWIEAVRFNNTSGTTAELTLFWETEGAVTDMNGPSIGSQSITSSIVLNNVNNSSFSPISLKSLTNTGLGGAQYNFSGVSGPGFTFQPVGNNINGAWTTALVGQNSGLISGTLLVPNGLSGLDIQALLNVDCRSGAICDYNTASFRFGALPTGLSFTSESGVFLSAVPEPGIVGLLVLGGLALLESRRRGAA